jgi:hypothetical protein
VVIEKFVQLGCEERAMIERYSQIVGALTEAFSDLMSADPAAFRSKFRSMARDPFAFLRGSACLYYADLSDGGAFAGADDRWTEINGARRIWIQGDLHAENFGTYLDAGGRLVFDVNDFDEAYLGHWTWDVMRFCASLALLCWQKALPDEAIDQLLDRYLRAYLGWVQHYVEAEDDTEWVRFSGMPGISGNAGCDRARACTWDFSSTHNTTAPSGGFK